MIILLLMGAVLVGAIIGYTAGHVPGTVLIPADTKTFQPGQHQVAEFDFTNWTQPPRTMEQPGPQLSPIHSDLTGAPANESPPVVTNIVVAIDDAIFTGSWIPSRGFNTDGAKVGARPRLPHRRPLASIGGYPSLGFGVPQRLKPNSGVVCWVLHSQKRARKHRNWHYMLLSNSFAETPSALASAKISLRPFNFPVRSQ